MTGTQLTIAEGGFSLSPRNVTEANELAKLIADSDIAPPGFKGKPGNVLVAVQMGAEVGLPPMQAIQNIAVINNRPTIWGDAALAIVQRHPEFISIEERNQSDAAKAGEGLCTIRRRNKIGEVIETVGKFSMADAKNAGLAGKAGPWTQYPGRMLQLRARAFCLRDSFADAMKGLAIREEVQDYQHVATTPEGVAVMMPRARVRTEAPASESAPAPQREPGDEPPETAAAVPTSSAKPNARVLSVEDCNGNGKTFFVVHLRNADGEFKASTFSTTDADTARALIGQPAVVETKQNGKYTNLLSIAAPA